MEKLIHNILDTYHEIFNISPISVTIKFSENVYKDTYELSPDCDKINAERNKRWIESLNGTIVVPEYVGEDFCILINKAYKDREPYNWVGTLCHELTHIYDYIDIANDLGSLRYKDYAKNEHSQMFELWTEFHARARGHYCLRNYIYKGDINNGEIANYNFTRELPFQVNNFLTLYQSNQGKGTLYEQVYPVMQFLGRLYVWKKLFPDNYTVETVHGILEKYKWMEELFYFLEENDEYDKVHQSFDQMKKIIEMN